MKRMMMKRLFLCIFSGGLALAVGAMPSRADDKALLAKKAKLKASINRALKKKYGY
jgi:hypothetical protein